MEAGGTKGAVREPRVGENIVVRDAMAAASGWEETPAIITKVFGPDLVSCRVIPEQADSYPLTSLSRQGSATASPGRKWRFPEDEELP